MPRSLLADATGSPAGPWNCLGGYVTGSPRSLLAEATDSEPGRSEDPDHYQELDMGYVFDIEGLGEDADRIAGLWRRFGGDGGDIDRHLNKIRGMPELKRLKKHC